MVMMMENNGGCGFDDGDNDDSDDSSCDDIGCDDDFDDVGLLCQWLCYDKKNTFTNYEKVGKSFVLNPF